MTRMIIRLATAVLLATAVSGGTIAATTKSSPIAQAAQTIKLNEKQAVAKFKQKYAKAKISEISLEKHLNHYQYEISGFDSQKEYSAKIDAQTGKLSAAKTEKLDADDHETAIKLNQVISRQKANQLAEKAAKSGQGREWTLETDHGQTIWQVDVVDGHQKTEVKINAVNKKVISVETDD
ncbi:MAG: PepSY domain-containing protein [Limosilactobacillus mucosae]|nr:PepSY domain-containing protein [Limosilactobacillus mucosae]MCI1490119.1 PepSY domain-containing protein [Limosilactobacillus mucosae]MCI1525801.1 PepSY domain-containing protein [Limosilactobacillus mucosae]